MHTVARLPMHLPNDQDASGRNFGAEETAALDGVLASGALTSTKGAYVRFLERDFARQLGVRYAYACASGSAAVHTAIAALDLEPGDEVVTTPITDMGALTPILYQAAIPVFADVDPKTYNVTARTIERALSERTKAIIATHLFGNPAEMADILALADSRGIAVIEDAAQALGATYNGKPAGTLGRIGCFSFQQGKHITCGEGGIVVTNDEALARRMYLFINKGWGYGDSRPDHYFLALNYRLSELQGAVAFAQLQKLDDHVLVRRERARQLTAALAGIPGIETPCSSLSAEHSYWKYPIRIDPQLYPGGPHAFAATLKDANISSAPRYIQKPAFMCQVFQEKRTFGTSSFPFTLARPQALDYRMESFPFTLARRPQALDYRMESFPGAAEALAHVLVLPINERYTYEHIVYVASALADAARTLRSES